MWFIKQSEVGGDGVLSKHLIRFLVFCSLRYQSHQVVGYLFPHEVTPCVGERKGERKLGRRKREREGREEGERREGKEREI